MGTCRQATEAVYLNLHFELFNCNNKTGVKLSTIFEPAHLLSLKKCYNHLTELYR